MAVQVILNRLSPQPPTPLEITHENEVDRIEFTFPPIQGSVRMKRPVRNLHESRVEDSHAKMQSVMGRSQLRIKFARAGLNFRRLDIGRIGQSGFLKGQQSSEALEVSNFRRFLSEEGFASVDGRAIEARRFWEGHAWTFR